jgi:hypothetical protein
MKDVATFTDTETEGLDEPWDIAAVPYGETDPSCIWNIVDGGSYPFLSWETAREVREIYDWDDLHGITDNLYGSYALMNDLDSTTAGYEELAGPGANDGMGWEPIGILEEPFLLCFSGIFDGQGYEIRDLFVNRPEEPGIGLFGIVAGGVIRNTGLAGAVVTGDDSVGAMAGLTFGGTLSNSYSTGNVTGSASVGGLVGWSLFSALGSSYSTSGATGYDEVGGLVGTVDEEYLTLLPGGTVYGSYATGNVTGYEDVGGLVGSNLGGNVAESYATGAVTGNSSVGGLVGYSLGNVGQSYATGAVTGNSYVGGLVGNVDQHILGFLRYSTVYDSYATGAVTGNSYVGGLVGNVDQHILGFLRYSTVYDSYATGAVTGNSYVGGLVGYSLGNVGDSYSTGAVSGNSSVGGLVGENNGTVTSSFWDAQTSGKSTSDGGTGKNTTEMKDILTFTDTDTEGLDEPWDIIAVADPGIRNPGYIWNIVDDETYPFLSWQSV